MPEPFGAVELVEIIELMIEGVIEPPCKHPTHIPWVWFGEAGQPICGVCHPPAVGRS